MHRYDGLEHDEDATEQAAPWVDPAPPGLIRRNLEWQDAVVEAGGSRPDPHAVFRVLRDAACAGLALVDAEQYERDRVELDRLRATGNSPVWSGPFTDPEPGIY